MDRKTCFLVSGEPGWMDFLPFATSLGTGLIKRGQQSLSKVQNIHELLTCKNSRDPKKCGKQSRRLEMTKMQNKKHYKLKQ